MLRQENPVGWLQLVRPSVALSGEFGLLRFNLLQRALTAALVLARDFERRHSHFPASLEALGVGASTVQPDPVTGQLPEMVPERRQVSWRKVNLPYGWNSIANLHLA
jgi:hypothetical protein